MAISMTREEYKKKYGVAPFISAVSTLDTSVAPRRMTRAEYDAEFNPPAKTPGIIDKTFSALNEINPLYQIPKMAIEGGLKLGEGIGKTITAKTQKDIVSGTVSAGAGAVQAALAVPFGMFEAVTNLPGLHFVKEFAFGAEKPEEFKAKYGIPTLPDLIGDKVSDIKPLQDFVMKYENSPEVASDVITIMLGLAGGKELEKPKLKADIQAEFQRAYDKAVKYTAEPISKIETGLETYKANKNIETTKVIANEIANIENNYAKLRKTNEFSKDAQASRERIAQTDVLVGAVDKEGTIRTKQEGGAVDQYKKLTIDGKEGVVRENLIKNKELVNLAQVERGLTLEVGRSGLEGADLLSALNGIKNEIRGLALKADEFGNIPVALAHDAKINTTKNINYATPPETATYRKAVARGYKTIVEENSKKFDVKPVNVELGKYLEDIKRLEALDGKKVKGGKLGKYTAQIAGNIAGASVGGAVGGLSGAAIGTIIGGETASFLKGKTMAGSFGKERGLEIKKNPILEKAKLDAKLPPEIDLTKPSPKVGAKAGIPRTKEIILLEKDIERNIAQQKTAIKAGDFTLVAKLKEIYTMLVDKLKEVIKKIKETPNKQGGFVKNPLSSPSPKSGKILKTQLKQPQQSSGNSTTLAEKIKSTGDQKPTLKNWQELSIKRALKDAVDNNSDYFAWINGEQTSARYNLATHVDNVKWSKFSSESTLSGKKFIEINLKKGDGSINIRLDKNGIIERADKTDWQGKKLDEVLGKGLADKILEKEKGTLSGEGLKFGGEWATNLYDKQVGNIVRDLTGAKVEVLDMGLPIEGNKNKTFFNLNPKVGRTFVDKETTITDLKVGKPVYAGETDYIITDVLGDGKFKAVPKDRLIDFSTVKKMGNRQLDYQKIGEKWYNKRNGLETFDISTKKSAGQQAIKLTPEIKALVKGEAIKLK